MFIEELLNKHLDENLLHGLNVEIIELIYVCRLEHVTMSLIGLLFTEHVLFVSGRII